MLSITHDLQDQLVPFSLKHWLLHTKFQEALDSGRASVNYYLERKLNNETYSIFEPKNDHKN